MTPDQYIGVICDFLDKKFEGYESARTFIKRNLQAILSHANAYQASGGSPIDPVVRTASRAFFYAAFKHRAPTGLFNIVMPANIGITTARVIAAYCAFIDNEPYFTSLDSLLQRQRMAWGDSDTSLPVDAPAIIAYDAEPGLIDYAGSRAFEEFSRKINPSRQAFIVFSETAFDDRPPKSNGSHTVKFNELGFGVIDFPGLIQETEDARG